MRYSPESQCVILKPPRLEMSSVSQQWSRANCQMVQIVCCSSLQCSVGWFGGVQRGVERCGVVWCRDAAKGNVMWCRTVDVGVVYGLV